MRINDSLVKFAKFELEKAGILIEKEINNESIKFTLLKNVKNVNATASKKIDLSQKVFSEIKEENSFLFSTEKKNKSTEQNDKVSLWEKYTNFTLNFQFNKHIILYIDYREGRLNKETGLFTSKIKEMGINCEEKSLPVGDFLWIYRDPSTLIEYVLDYIIERKTLDDLAKSIIDGRYEEQKFRLKNCGLKNIYYLFEGNSFSNSHFSIQKSAIQSAIFHTINIHDINIIKTSNLKDTINYLKKLHDIIVKIEFDVEKLQIFGEFSQKNGKNKNVSVETVFSKQLGCVI